MSAAISQGRIAPRFCIGILTALMAIPRLTIAAESPSIADLDLTPLLPVWNPLYSFSIGTGFRDNLLLSKEHREQSGFFSSAFDFSLWRRPVEDGRELQVALSIADRRFWAQRTMDHETWGFLHAKYLHDLNDRWQWITSLEGSYFDQVVDVSFLESTPARERLQGGTATLSSGLRWRFDEKNWIQLSPLASRTWLRGAFDSFNDFGGVLSFGHRYGRKSEWRLEYTLRERLFSRREQTTLTGNSIPGTTLEYQQHELNWIDTHFWDTARRWKTTTRIGGLTALDNGGSYYDYWRLSASESISYHTHRWSIALEATLSRYQFPQQRSTSSPGQIRMRDDFNANVRTEYHVSRDWKLFLDYSYETVVASDVLEAYTANTVSGGLGWEF